MLYIESKDRIKIIDLGLAKILDFSDSNFLGSVSKAMTTSFVGSPIYMCP
jgi:hypothetical protein